MIGHLQILKARKIGEKPAAIFFQFGYPVPVARFDYEHPERAMAFKLYPVVHIEPEEIKSHHDLRFAFKCHCHVDINEADQDSMDFLDELVKVGADAVVAVCMKSGIMMTYYGEWEAYAPE